MYKYTSPYDRVKKGDLVHMFGSWYFVIRKYKLGASDPDINYDNRIVISGILPDEYLSDIRMEAFNEGVKFIGKIKEKCTAKETKKTT